MVEPILLWAGQHWPLTDDDHEFIVSAFTRIGRALHGDKWSDDFPTRNPLKVSALLVEDASPEERAWCHRTLSAFCPADYEEDYEMPPAPRLQGLAALGTMNSQASVLTPFDGSARAPGWWFSQDYWDRFRALIHHQNELRKPEIDMVDQTARWLFNQIVRGAITPFAQNIKNGGDWRATTADDWRMPSPERLRLRVQRCSMVPGHPSVPGGTHWIFINRAELNGALAAQHRLAPLSNPDAPPLSAPHVESEEGSGGISSSDATNWWRGGALKAATDRAAELLRINPTATREGLFALLKPDWPHLTPNFLRNRIWAQARIDAGLRAAGSPGKRKTNSAA